MSMESSELETYVGIHKYSTEGGFIFKTLSQQAKKKTIINTKPLILQGTKPKRI
jgi:hypothetical protein